MNVNDLVVQKRYRTIINTMVFFLLWAFFQPHITGFNNFFTNLLGGYFFLVLEALVMIIIGFQFIAHPSSVKKKCFIFAIFFIVLYVILSFAPVLNGYGFYIKIFIFPVLISGLFICLRAELKVVILEKFIKIISYILTFSIIEYLIYQISGLGVILFSNNTYNDINYIQLFFNYLEDGFVISRFRSLTIEPGNIGTACGLLLFVAANSRKFRYQYIIFWISGILSFSLAFFIIAAIHLVSLRAKGLPFLAVAIGLLIGLSIQFSELFEVFITNRLEDKSVEEIDNRSHVDIDQLMASAWNDGSLWMGRGNYIHGRRYDGTFANGIKGHIYSYGIISVSMVIILYIYIFFSEIKECRLRNDDYFAALLFLVAFFMSYYQREYIFMIDYVVPFVTLPYFIKYKSNMLLSKGVKVNTSLRNA